VLALWAAIAALIMAVSFRLSSEGIPALAMEGLGEVTGDASFSEYDLRSFTEIWIIISRRTRKEKTTPIPSIVNFNP